MKKIEHKIFPVCLLLDDKPCLVVGGGKVASRKVSLLLEAGAQITVIAPEISDEIRAHSDAQTINYINREFIDEDINGFKLVYSATNNKVVNNRILLLCREQHILCCIIDSGWTDGDFLTPASVRQKDITVAISTGGKACRRSRLVKSSLSRHLSLIDNSTLAVIGTSHLQLTTERREAIHSTGEDYQLKAGMIRQLWGIHEFVFLNTCNRIELFLAGSVTPEIKHLLKRILLLDNLNEKEFYYKEGLEAFEHGVSMCAGLLSQLPGENHIAAQLKETVSSCVDSKWAGTIMQEWLASTLHLSREVRQLISPILKSEEFEDIALKYIISEAVHPSSITLLGTGMVGKEMLHKILTTFPDTIVNWFFHNQIPEIPVQFKDRIKLSSFDNFPGTLKSADVIISAVRSDTPVITPSHESIINPEAIVIDLSVPRTIDANLKNSICTLKMIDLDGLKIWYRIEQVDRANLLSISHEIVQTNRDIYDKFITSITGRNT
jgi:siroheme synthase-like protein